MLQSVCLEGLWLGSGGHRKEGPLARRLTLETKEHKGGATEGLEESQDQCGSQREKFYGLGLFTYSFCVS